MTVYTHTAIILEELEPSLPNLADLCRTTDALEVVVDEMVAKLREEGTTWRVLAEATGMTEAGLMGRQRRLATDRYLRP